MRLNHEQNILFPALLALLSLVLAMRALFGFCWSDESFYLTFSDRLWKGQQLITDEWHPVQFYAVIVHPFLTVYRFFFGTTGMYLFLRLLYVAFAFGVSLYLYNTLARMSSSGAALLCACLYLTYSRGDIWGVSYYNLFLSLALLSACLALRDVETTGKGRDICLLFSGVCLAGSVLCVPYFAPFVIVFLVIVFFSQYRKDALWAAAGIAAAAVAFIICFLPKDMKAVLENLLYIFSDPEHTTGPVKNLLQGLSNVVFMYRKEIILTVTAVLLVILSAKTKLPVNSVCMLVLSIGAAVSFYCHRGEETGFANYTLVLFCLPLLALSWAHRLISVRVLLIRILGIFMMISLGLSSNTRAIAFTSGLTIYAIGMVLQLEYLTRENREHSFRGWVTGLVCVTLLLTLNTRITKVYRDGPLETLNTPMSEGPAAGIRTTPEHAQQYQKLLTMLQELNNIYSPENHIFISKLMPWGYPVSDFKCGAPTVWRTPLNSARLENYYAIHPQCIPDIVVVLADNVGDYPGKTSPNENTREGWLWDYMAEHQYEKIEYALADVYISPEASRREK